MIAMPGPGPDHSLLNNPELGGDLVGGAPANTAYVAGQAVELLGDHRDRLLAMGLEYPDCLAGTDTVGVQEEHAVDEAEATGIVPFRRHRVNIDEAMRSMWR